MLEPEGLGTDTITGMDLFGFDPQSNLLPCDGDVFYFGPVFEADEASSLFEKLLTSVPWQNDEVFLFGKHISTARKVAWYADSQRPYSYSGTTKTPLPWTDELLTIKGRIELIAHARFNSCLLNLYHDGSEGMSWHSDNESSLEPNGTIASLSLGAERKFCMKHKLTGQSVSLVLNHGSLLVMKGTTQKYWLHSIPKTKTVHTPRINLTFRQMR